MIQENSSGRDGILWLKLNEFSKNLLLERFPPKYPNIYYDHITLAYAVTPDKVSEFIGKTSKAEAYAIACNNKVEAIRIITDRLPDTYGVPHITLTTIAGVKPFESVAMLTSEHNESPIDPSLTIEGYIEFVPL